MESDKSLSETDILESEEQLQTAKRETWNNSLEFTFSCVANTVGLGNIMRFPYTASQNGGGAFLVNYLFVAVAMGKPLYYIEILLGQFSSKAGARGFKALAPGLGGIGWAQVIGCISISSTYGALITFFSYYFVQCFSTVLPWTMCKPEWGNSCVTLSNIAHFDRKHKFSEELYFFKEVLRITPNLKNGLGTPKLSMVICGFFTWFTAFCLVSSGVKRSGRISYFLALFPYFILLILMERTSRFEGAYTGIWYFLKPNWSMMFNAKVLFEAINQNLFSFSQGLGVTTVYASYNEFTYHAKTVSIVVLLFDLFTNLVSGITNFAVLGHLAEHVNITLDNFPTFGPGLIFVSYPQAITTIKARSNLFTGLFFLMLFIIGISSLQGMQVVVIHHLKYLFPRMKIWQLGIISTTVCFGLSITYFTPGGIHIVDIVIVYGGDMILCGLTTAILFSVLYCYGLQNFCWDVEYMNQKPINCIWRVTWSIIDVCVLSFAIIRTFLWLPSWNTEIHPRMYQVFAWFIFLSVILPIPTVMLITLIKNRRNGFKQSFQKTFTNENWRPYEDEYYEEWKMLKAAVKKKRDERRDNFLLKFLKTLLRMYD